jgi:Spy/CpxP family protein refolding chaperone
MARWFKIGESSHLKTTRESRMKHSIRGLIMSSLVLCVALPAFAQPAGMRSGHGMGRRPWRGEQPCWTASELNLSPEQAKALDLLGQTYFQEAKRYRIELFSKRLELREYLTNPTVKAEVIQAKDGEIIELQSKMEEKTIEYLLKVRTLLTLEQLKVWCPEQEFPMLQRMMERPLPMGPPGPRPSPPPEGKKE